MQESLQKLQNLLQQLFRADAADLDFGIYRIINYRRDQLQAFIDEELPTIVNNALDANAEAASAHEELEDLKKRVKDAFGEDVLDADGILIDETIKDRPLVKQYLEAQEQLGSPQPETNAKIRFITTSTPSSPATTITATLSRADAIPKPNATLSHTTVRRYTSTGQIETSTTSKVVSISPLIVSNLKTPLLPLTCAT